MKKKETKKDQLVFLCYVWVRFSSNNTRENMKRNLAL